MNTPTELSAIYQRRFADSQKCRARVWQVLCDQFFSRWVNSTDSVLDLGCGYGEFINNIKAARRYGMDLNPDSPKHLHSEVEFLAQDCSEAWPLPDGTLNVVFTSNFLEHLPDKSCVQRTIDQAHRCLKQGGRLIAMGPNIKYIPGQYWDFFDHHVMLTELSLSEALETRGFTAEVCVPRFLPYTMVNAPEYPILLLRLYLRLPWFWWVKGRQFLVVARKSQS